MDYTVRHREFFYRKKMDYMIASAGDKGMASGEHYDPDMAEEVLRRFRRFTESEDHIPKRVLTGSEFAAMPPTESGHIAQIEGIVRAMETRTFLEETVVLGSDVGFADVFEKEIKVLCSSLDDAVRTWFLSCGIDKETGEACAAEEMRQARKDMPQVSDSYSKTFRSCGEKIGAALGAHCKTLPEYGEIRDRLIADRRPDYSRMESIIGDADISKEKDKNLEYVRDEYIRLMDKVAELCTESDIVDEIVRTKFAREDSSAVTRAIFSQAAVGFRSLIDDRINVFYTIGNFALLYVESVLTGRPMGVFASEFVRKNWNGTPNEINTHVPISSLPGYVDVRSIPIPFPDTLKTLDEVEAEYEKLLAYRQSHQDQFENHTMPSLFLYLDDLPAAAGVFRNLRNSISYMTKNRDYLDSLSEEEKDRLLEIWIDSDVMTRVAFLVLEFCEENCDNTIDDISPTFLDDTYEMGYMFQERKVKKALTEIFWKRASHVSK